MMPSYKVFIKDAKNLDSFIAPKSVDLLLSGPPYHNEVVYSRDQGQLSLIENYQEFLKAIAPVWSACSTVLKPGAMAAVWLHDYFQRGQDGFNYIAFHSDLARSFPPEMVLKNIWIWDRYLNRDKGVLPDKPIGTRYMYVLVFQKRGVRPNNQKLIQRSLEKSYWEPVWKKKTSAKFLGSENLFKAGFNFAKPFGARLDNLKNRLKRSAAVKDAHSFSVYSTECPEEIVERLISDYSVPGDLVLDPFLGSGTVMKIAGQMGRSCFGVEINRAALPAIQKKVSLPGLEIIV